MTIEYKDSKRIVKLSGDVVDTVTFEDDFSTAKSWGKTGTLTARNASTNVMDWDCDSSSIQSSTYDLGSALSTQFVIRSKLTIDQIDIMATDSYQGYFGVYSADHATGVASIQNGFALYIINDAGGNAKQYRIRVDDGTSGFGNTAGDGGNFTKKPTVETVYLELIRDGDIFTINLYSDSTYSTLIEGKSFTQTSVTGLQYLGIKNHLRDSTGGLNGTWDDVKVYNGVSSITSKPTNVQDNSILVEKDTARRYWFDVESTNESAFYSASESTVTYTDGEDVSSKATNIISMAVSPDGTHFYVGEEAGGIHQYDLGTAWDISTAVWQREYTHGVVNPKGLFFSTDGTYMYLGIFNSSDIKRYPLTTAWDVSTVGSTDQSYSTGLIQDLWFSSDGTKMLWSDNSGNVKKLVLGTAWTINSNTSGSQTVNPSDITGIGAVQFKPDGTKMFLGGWDSSGRIKQYALATAFDLSTVSFTQEYNASAQTSDIQGMALSATGDKFFVLDNTNDYIRQYDADTVTPATWTWDYSATRGVFAGGNGNTVMDYITIDTLGNAIDFGDLTQGRWQSGGISSETRGVITGGATPGDVQVNTMDYVTIATTGNAIDFGDLTTARRGVASVSNLTRGVTSGSTVNVIDYITIATTGNATDFGDLTIARIHLASVSSLTRGVFGGGSSSNVMDYITIATIGNAIDFGDLTVARQNFYGISSFTRGVFGGRYPTGNITMDYITIDTTGNAANFGDLTQARYAPGGVSSYFRGCFGGGNTTVDVNTIDYITIDTLGNAIDFGDLTVARPFAAGVQA